MLAHLGVQNLRRSSNSSLSISPREALLENVVARMWRRVPWLRYHTRLLRELSAQPATCLAIPMSAVISHRTPGYATRCREGRRGSARTPSINARAWGVEATRQYAKTVAECLTVRASTARRITERHYAADEACPLFGPGAPGLARRAGTSMPVAGAVHSIKSGHGETQSLRKDRPLQLQQWAMLVARLIQT
jgi:hypothetical protein